MKIERNFRKIERNFRKMMVKKFRENIAESFSQFMKSPSPLQIVEDECKRVYSATRWIKLKSAKALRVRREQRQVTLHKWKERLSGSSKREWTCLLIHHLEAWLERGQAQMNFYLIQFMAGYGAFNTYLFCMKLADSLDCSNCDRRG